MEQAARRRRRPRRTLRPDRRPSRFVRRSRSTACLHGRRATETLILMNVSLCLRLQREMRLARKSTCASVSESRVRAQRSILGLTCPSNPKPLLPPSLQIRSDSASRLVNASI